jgi:hypothetical protein
VPDLSKPVHFSNLKNLALSPAHYLASLGQAWDPTRDMKVGSYGHQLVLGPRKRGKAIAVYDGDIRSGSRWQAFALANKDKDIVTAPEAADAKPMADAIQADAVASKLLERCRFEVPLVWSDAGLGRETDGIDAIAENGEYIVDLKFTSCTEPLAFQRHCTKMMYHAQMADYSNAARLNGIDVRAAYVIGVERRAPYAVTCLRVIETTLAQGMKSVVLWSEKLRSCIENDHWPTYTQAIVDYELPPWMGDDGEVDT